MASPSLALARLLFLASTRRDDHGTRALWKADATPHELALPPREPDRTLVLGVRDGNEAMFESLYHTHYAAMCTLAHRYVHAPDVAEEIAQDVLLSIWFHRSTWNVRESVRAYVLGAVRHAALNYLRRQRLEQRWERTAALLTPDAADPHAEADRHEIETLVHALLAELPESRRTVATFRWIDGLSYAEIADALGVSTKAVEVQLYRTLRALRQRLAPAIGE